MTTNGDITIFHYDEASESYTRSYFPEVFRGHTVQIASEKGGFAHSDIARIRIPTEEEITVSVGDYVFFGKASEDAPEKEKCVRVMGFRDNRFGVLPHWRIDMR